MLADLFETLETGDSATPATPADLQTLQAEPAPIGACTPATPETSQKKEFEKKTEKREAERANDLNMQMAYTSSHRLYIKNDVSDVSDVQASNTKGFRETSDFFTDVADVAPPNTAYYRWLIHFTDRDPLTVSFSPEATHSEALTSYPDAVAAEPLPDPLQRAGGPENSTCADHDDRRTCGECAELSAGRICMAAKRGELEPGRKWDYKPALDLAQRCACFSPACASVTCHSRVPHASATRAAIGDGATP